MSDPFDPELEPMDRLLQAVLAVAGRCLPEQIWSGRLESRDDELELELLARDLEGEPSPEWMIRVEVYPSEEGRSMMLELPNRSDWPLLWQGQQPVWMDDQGRKCDRPAGGEALEALARKLRLELP
jgi:hypothetical protein